MSEGDDTDTLAALEQENASLRRQLGELQREADAAPSDVSNGSAAEDGWAKALADHRRSMGLAELSRPKFLYGGGPAMSSFQQSRSHSLSPGAAPAATREWWIHPDYRRAPIIDPGPSAYEIREQWADERYQRAREAAKHADPSPTRKLGGA
jgi:hypothetical protein